MTSSPSSYHCFVNNGANSDKYNYATVNLILTPHIAWAAREARQRCLDQVATNIADFLKGGTRNRVV